MSEMDPHRFLITGADGMIGRAIPMGIKLGRSELDVTDFQNVQQVAARHAPQAIVHLANLDLRQCERQPYAAVRTNVEATRHVLHAARTHGIPLIFLSSGSVFFGPRGTVFDEDASPDPQNLYAACKVVSEEMLLREYPTGTLVVRTGWVFGGHGAHHPKFVDSVIDLAREEAPILAAADQEGSPVFVEDLVREMFRLMISGQRGIIHIVNAGQATPLQITEFITQSLGSRSSIGPYIRTADEQRIRRSPSEVLASRHVKLRPWQEALGEYIHRRTATARV